MTTISESSSHNVSGFNIILGDSMTEEAEKILDWKVYKLGEYLNDRLKKESFGDDYMTYWHLYNKHYHQQKRGWKSATIEAIRELENIEI